MFVGADFVDQTLILHHIEFHWSQSGSGSEHSINGRRYAAEMHLYHYNSLYSTFEAAEERLGGLTIVGVMLALGVHNNSNIKRVLDPIESGEVTFNSTGFASGLIVVSRPCAWHLRGLA